MFGPAGTILVLGSNADFRELESECKKKLKNSSGQSASNSGGGSCVPLKKLQRNRLPGLGMGADLTGFRDTPLVLGSLVANTLFIQRPGPVMCWKFHVNLGEIQGQSKIIFSKVFDD